MEEWSGFTYIFEPDVHRVRVCIHGVLDDAVLANAFREIYQDPGYVAGMNELCDCTEVSRVEMTTLGVKALMNVVKELQTSETPYRVGIVAPRKVIFGLARMYELLQDDSMELVRVVDSLEAAEAFTAGYS